MANYLHDGVLLYLDQLVDWETYFTSRKGPGTDVAAEKSALLDVLRTCAEICAQIEPLARAGWSEPARLEDGEVVVPEHVARGYQLLADAGLTALSVSERYGGFDLPALVSNLVIQMVSRSSPALMTIMGLQGGVAEDIERYADEELRQLYLPGFTGGRLQGAMDLTEPQAGSDLGAIATRAYEEGGCCFLEGQKIFITNGGSEVHLVLARDNDTFEQSKGTTRGLSLFLCPRTLPDGTPNRLRVERLEHKLGLHGSPTCAIRFDRAQAWRIARKGEGFKAMLDLMNNARLGVAAQGIGIAEAALEEALRYARERRQFGRPIGEQPLMKNMLSRCIVHLEGARALLYRCSALIDANRAIEARLAGKDLSDAERSDLQRRWENHNVCIRLLTPLAKYYATETCDDITRTAIQVHGGIGFMAETAVGRLHLDGIITTIYEGTSEIQVSFALKEIGKGALGIVFDQLSKELGELTDPALVPLAERVQRGIGRIVDASLALVKDFNYALLSARNVAEMAIHVIAATELLRQAQADPARVDLAALWIGRKMLELEMYAQRLIEGDVTRLERCERVVKLWS
jgi:alkylation response protein AidB-like acyl-CoA dehydrogenase